MTALHQVCSPPTLFHSRRTELFFLYLFSLQRTELIPAATLQAALHDDVGTMAQLLKKKADPDQTMEFDWTPLHTAALAGSDGCAAALLQAKCDALAQNEDGMSPLHLAAAKGHASVVSTLLGGGASAGARSRNGSCPYDCAAAAGHTDIMALVPQEYEEDDRFDDPASFYFYEKPGTGGKTKKKENAAHGKREREKEYLKSRRRARTRAHSPPLPSLLV